MTGKIEEMTAIVNSLVDAHGADALAGADLDSISAFMLKAPNSRQSLSERPTRSLSTARALGRTGPVDFSDQPPNRKCACQSSWESSRPPWKLFSLHSYAIRN